MKKIISVLLTLATVVTLFSSFTIQSSAATTTAFDTLTSSRYSKVYTLSYSGKTIPYTNTELTQRGSVTYGKSSTAYISNSADELYLYDVGINSKGVYYAYVSYPIGSKRAYAYIPLSAITANNGNHVKSTATGKFYCSHRNGYSTSSSYYVDKGDTVYLISTSGSTYQIMYPISDGKWRIGFCSKSNYNKFCKPEIKVTSVYFRYTSYRLTGKYATATILSTVYPNNATNKSLVWKSSNTAVATVDSKGKITSVGAGTTYITATSSNGKSASAKLKVEAVVSNKIKLNYSNLTLSGTGKTKTLSTSVTPSNSTDKITWKSSNPSVATVNGNGKVTAVKNGTATITATTSSGKTARVTVTCKNCNTYSVSNNILTVNGVKMSEFSIGSKYINSRYVYVNGKRIDMYAWQCCGYARYIQYKLYGSHYFLNSSKFPNLAGSDNVYPNANGYKKLITAAGVGAHIRTLKNNKGIAHSMIVIDITENGFTITDANSDGNNTIRIKTYSWSEYANCSYGTRGLDYIEVYKK